MSFLQETIEALGKFSESDVLWVGSKDGKFVISWDRFKELADFEYNSGYGAAEIAQDLVVVGDCWWLERHEYDGSEWWELKTIPKPQKVRKNITNLSVVGSKKIGWCSLKELNKSKGGKRK